MPTTTTHKNVTLSEIAKAHGNSAALAALAARLGVERDALGRRTLDTTIAQNVALGRIADAVTRASASYDANSTTLTESDFIKAVGITRDGSWQTWSVPTIKMALVVARAHTAEYYATWSDLVARFVPATADDAAHIAPKGKGPAVVVETPRIPLFKPHAVAYANWVNLRAAGTAHDDGGFTEKPATIAARDKAAAERKATAHREKNAADLAGRYVADVVKRRDDVAFGTLTFAALANLSAEEVQRGADILSALAAALVAGTYTAVPAETETETGATEPAPRKRTRKVAAA